MSATTTSPRSASQLEAVVMVTPAAASKSQSGSPAAAQDDLPRSTLSESAAAPGVQSLRKKDGDNSGQKDTVKGPCTAYRRYRRAEIPQLAEVHDVRANEGTEHTADVGHSVGMSRAEHPADDGRHHRWNQHRRGDPYPRNRTREAMHHECYDSGADEGGNYHRRPMENDIGRDGQRHDCSTDIDGNGGRGSGVSHGRAIANAKVLYYVE